MPRVRAFGSAPPQKKKRTLPTMLEMILATYGPTLDSVQVMAVLHVGRTTLCTLTTSGVLPCRRIGGHRVFSAIDINEFLEEVKDV